MAEVKIKSAVDIGSGPKKHDDVEAQNLQKATVTDYVEETEDSEELGKVINWRGTLIAYPLLLSIAIVMVVMSLQAMSLLESDMQKKKQVKEKR